jgi:sulfofructose kinase
MSGGTRVSPIHRDNSSHGVEFDSGILYPVAEYYFEPLENLAASATVSSRVKGPFQAVDVVGVGLNATDTLIRLPHFPAFDSKVELLSVDVRPGGQVASALVACQKWGLRTRYIGKVGDDAPARLQAEELAKAGVEAHLFNVAACSSQFAFILIDEKTGERTILWKRDPRLEMRPEEIDPEWIRSAKILLVDGHDTAAAAEAARIAREARIPVVADLDNLYAGVQVLLEYVDFLIASRGFPERLTGEKDLLKSLPEIMRRFKCRVTGVTLGRLGALAWDGNRFHYSAGYVTKAVDTTGAGDIFHGAFVYSVLNGWPLERSFDFSCAAAALNCVALGARGGIGSVDEIEHLMASGARSESPFPVDGFAVHGRQS